jgi:uncharacterized repeat protein (TIGR02543 family)
MGTVDVGWTFTGWSGGGCSGTAPCTVTMNSDITVTANFTQITHSLTITMNPAGGGTTTPSAGVHSYVEGTIVPVTAAPTAGYVFDHWNGACTGSGSCSVTMSMDKNITATFKLIEYTLTVNISGSGLVTKNPDKTTYHFGDVVQLTATADTGWNFSAWSGDMIGIEDPKNITINGNKSITATFIQNEYTLTVNSAHAAVTKAPDQLTYTYGTSVLLTMGTVDVGWTFTGWSGGGCSGTAPCTVTMYSDITVTANFTLSTYILDVSKTGTGAGTVTSNPAGINCGLACSEAYNYNTPVTLSVSASTGSTFTVWNGACTGTGTCHVMMNAAKSVTATFTLNTKRIFLPLVIH